MNILITGGAGYIGMELVSKLAPLKEVTKIVIYDNLSRDNYNLFIGTQKLNNKVHFVNGDILDIRKLNKQVEKANIVYHLAAKVSFPFMDTNPHEFDQINNWGTSEVVYAVENSNVEKFVYLSSVSVYGANDQEVTSTDDQLSPMTYYGISKKKAEGHVERLFPKKNTYLMRGGNVYGYSKGMRFDSVINRFMFEANYIGKITIKGTGNQIRTFIHIDSICNKLAMIVTDEIKPGTYNLTESNWSIMHTANTVRSIYPNTEMLFINQDFPMKSISVKPDEKLVDLKESNLQEELSQFKENFTF